MDAIETLCARGASVGTTLVAEGLLSFSRAAGSAEVGAIEARASTIENQELSEDGDDTLSTEGGDLWSWPWF